MKSLWPYITSSDDVEQMMISIVNNRLDEVKRLIAKGVTGRTRGGGAHAPHMSPDEIGMFHYACDHGNVEAAKLLYTDDMNLEERMQHDMTPLMAACQSIRSPDWASDNYDGPQDPDEVSRAEALIRWLVEQGADVNAVRSHENTVLHCAAHGCTYEIIAFLIAHGARVDWPDEDRQSAFIVAARANNVPALRAFAEHGANINRPSLLPWAEGRTALGILELERAQGYPKPESIAYLRSIGAKEWPDGASS